MSTLFTIESVTAGYENKVVLKDISMTVDENVHWHHRSNSGGKTTLPQGYSGPAETIFGRIDFSRVVSGSADGYMPQVAQGDTLFPVTVEDVVLSR
jgi:zinc transport system ATP-binding protein